MVTLHPFSKFARRTQPRGDAGTSAPTEYPSSSAGALFLVGEVVDEAGRVDKSSSGQITGRSQLTSSTPIVEGDGPLESGLTPSPSIDTLVPKVFIMPGDLTSEQLATLYQAAQEINRLTARLVAVKHIWSDYELNRIDEMDVVERLDEMFRQ